MVTVPVWRFPPGSLAALKCTKGASSLCRGFLVLALWLAEALELEFPCGPPGIRWHEAQGLGQGPSPLPAVTHFGHLFVNILTLPYHVLRVNLRSLC